MAISLDAETTLLANTPLTKDSLFILTTGIWLTVLYPEILIPEKVEQENESTKMDNSK